MTEKEYRLYTLKHNIEKFINKKIVLYGAGANTKAILENFPELNIIGIMDSWGEGTYKLGKLVLTENQIFELGVDVILVGAQISSAKSIYDRIGNFCYSNRIKLYDMYGNDLFSVNKKITEEKLNYYNKNYTQLLEKIDKCSVISFDIWDTLIIKDWKNNVLIRKPMTDAFKYAVAQGKKVYLVSTEEIRKENLENYGISGYFDIVCGTDTCGRKQDGLLRKVFEQNSNEPILHIGDDEIEDGLVPLMYNMDIYLIKSPMDMLKQIVGYVEEKNETVVKYNQYIIQNYIAEVLHDPFIFYNKEDKIPEDLDLSAKLIKVQQNLQWHKEQTRHDLVLFDSTKLVKWDTINFELTDRPRVSIVIPAYNQFHYTYYCLKSIEQNTQNVNYEIIVADDCSTDLTSRLEEIVKGIKVIHNCKNLNFLLSCNNAAESAAGDFILFLNNDTQVQPGWLEPLVDLMDRDASIGMTGAKLIYPDGYLQEAGGILWNDGSAWNFGRMQNPDIAEFNYVREVDYISGAAIMVRKSLWEKIGGFDERYVPAYYEDTDLAFEVRRHGYKVVYQPLSEVVHFEGASNGTDVQSGGKAYQEANKEKFYNKWKHVLIKEHFDNGKNLFWAKDRSRKKKQILVVDHYVPNYDKDAGGRCTYMYLKTFLKMGYQVTFIGDNFAKMEPYTTELLQMGIQVLYGNYYYFGWKYWLAENLKYFDFVYLQRPHISIKYIDIIKYFSNAKIFYFAHDLHHLREYRKYLLDKDTQTLETSKYWKKIEYELFEKSDVGHVVGSYEQEIMQKAFPDKPIRNIPLYVYENLPVDIPKNFAARADLLTVGGFGHPPNEDAVLWFAEEIFPKILAVYPDIKWHIVGGRITEKVLRLKSDNIILEGFVSDDALLKLYMSCRLAVVPLRYGAGVKGKVVEASYYQIPLITTSIGAEGISCKEKSFLIEDDADKIAELVCDIYEDYDKLRIISDNGKAFIENHFMLSSAQKVLLKDMD